MRHFSEFLPKSYLYLRSAYSRAIFKKDLLAGITVGILSLPLAMAFAIASGVTPDRGLFTAIVAGFLISALGGSRVQIGGPTGAFAVIIYGIIQRTGYEGLVASTLIAAIILILLGIFRLGSWIKYVPHPLIVGFTTGLAFLIFSSQIKDFFGLQMETVPLDVVDKWSAYIQWLPTFQPITLCISGGTLGTILLFRKFLPRLPWGIAAIVLSTSLCWFFDLPVETIQSKFGQMPASLPWPHLPTFAFPAGKAGEVLMDGCVIAFLGAIESLLCCVIADGMIGGHHKSNCELVGQGIANLGSILFGGIPATGAIARTAANIKSGAQTPIAGMIHALVLLAIISLFSPIVSKVPLGALAAILMMVAWNMSEMAHFLRLFKAPPGDMLILAVSFLLTVFIDITVAITLGMAIASLIFMKRMGDYSKTVPMTQMFGEFPERNDPDAIAKKAIPPGVEVYEIQGPFFFGAADLLQDVLPLFRAPPKVFILRMRHVPMIDASGMQALQKFYHDCKKGNTTLLLSGIHEQTKKELELFGLADLIGSEHIFPHIDGALAKAADLAN